MEARYGQVEANMRQAEHVPPPVLFVEAASGLQGLVRGGKAAVGAMLRVRVIEFDAAESRFSAKLVD
jgi:hypothetical protein